VARQADPRYELVLDQALRGLTQQQSSLDGLRSRAGTLIAASSLVSSFLGAATLKNTGLSAGAVLFLALALVAFATVVVGVVIILLPYEWKWGIDPHAMLHDYVESATPADIDGMRRDLAYYIGEDLDYNRTRLDRLFRWLRIATVAIAAEVALWTLALALAR
jgi:hypothetical protein